LKQVNGIKRKGFGLLFKDEVEYIEPEDDDEIVAKVPRKKVPVSTKKNLSKKEISDCLDTLKFN
jgi:hypothetical protein